MHVEPRLRGGLHEQLVSVARARGTAEVLFLDYGSRDRAFPLAKLTPLDATYFAAPPQARECALAFVKAPGPDDEYFSECGYAFSDLAYGRDLTMKIFRRNRENVLEVALFDPEVPESVNETLGTARTAFETNAIIFDMACRTGQCIPHNQSAIPKPKHHPHRAISGWAIAAIVVLAAVAALGVALAIGMRAQRRPATAAKDGGRELEASNPGVALAFQRVSYDVPKPGGGQRRVLQGATGLVRPGELCAIMGPSGAGKSSCLDILGGQDKRGTVGGRACFVLPDWSHGVSGGLAAAPVPLRHAGRPSDGHRDG